GGGEGLAAVGLEVVVAVAEPRVALADALAAEAGGEHVLIRAHQAAAAAVEQVALRVDAHPAARHPRRDRAGAGAAHADPAHRAVPAAAAASAGVVGDVGLATVEAHVAVAISEPGVAAAGAAPGHACTHCQGVGGAVGAAVAA